MNKFCTLGLLMAFFFLWGGAWLLGQLDHDSWAVFPAIITTTYGTGIGAIMFLRNLP